MRQVMTICLMLMSLTTIAQPQDPIKFLEKVSSSVMSELKKNKEVITKDPNKIYSLIESLIIPNVDFPEMGTWIAGRKIWMTSSPAQQNEFIKQFKVLVVKTYGSALVSYSNDKVVFPPQSIDATKERLEVSSWIKRSSEDIRVKYRLIKKGDLWKVYDIEVEGVSILNGFIAQFSKDIRANGLQSAIKQIKAHNDGNK
jgi:phospholipid transport system substrate-binding protein